MISEVSSTVIISMPKGLAWEKLRNLALAHYYVPGLVKVEFNTPQKEGIGASRRVFLSKTKSIDETVVEWDAGSGFVVRLHKASGKSLLPFKQMYFRYRLKGAGQGEVTLTASMAYTMRMGRVGSLLERWLLRKIFESMCFDVAIGIKQFYESNVPVTIAVLKQLRGEAKKC